MNFFRTIRFISSVTAILCLFESCKSYKEQEDQLPDNGNRGTIRISADESFKPVIDEQVKVYEANHPGTKILVNYKF